ncbi:MAG TPA: DUF4188 domain-containing protein [Segeticoccus sp.]|nr:DUF4188 domain-containing protein [Segeticoccus sp.]
MTAIRPGRVTDDHEGTLVVFLIGMRVNRWWRPDQWLPPFLGMPRMLTELYAAQHAGAHGHQGFLGHRSFVGSGGATVLQYWRSVEELNRYAAAVDGEHRPAWRAFNERVRRAPGAVGIWHETYVVPAGAHESIYHDMPATGLGAVAGLVPVARRGERARQRLAA